MLEDFLFDFLLFLTKHLIQTCTLGFTFCSSSALSFIYSTKIVYQHVNKPVRFTVWCEHNSIIHFLHGNMLSWPVDSLTVCVFVLSAVKESASTDIQTKKEQVQCEPRQKLRIFYQVNLQSPTLHIRWMCDLFQSRCAPA